jgi:hypothetical protein
MMIVGAKHFVFKMLRPCYHQYIFSDIKKLPYQTPFGKINGSPIIGAAFRGGNAYAC